MLHNYCCLFFEQSLNQVLGHQIVSSLLES